MILLLLSLAARADSPDEAVATPRPTEAAPLSALGLFQTRITRSSVISTNPFLDGQVVGALGGSNGTTTSLDERSMSAEQRAVAFLSWAPTALDGRAALTAGFEVDFAWGDQSYQTGGNKGGGFGADQVNLQTRRLYASFQPLRGDHEIKVLTGLQFVADSAWDPHSSTLNRLARQGGGLGIWGSEAAGVSVFGRHSDGWGERLAWRLGGYTLVENGLGLGDDLTLWMADASLSPEYRVDLGLHAWWLKDNTGGSGGTLGLGPTSQLSAMQGGPDLNFGDGVEVDADLIWLAADVGWNRELRRGPVGARALGLFNLGRLYLTDLPDVPVRGWMVNAEVRGRYARGSGSELSAQLLATSRDGSGQGAYTGLVTGNSYGVVGATWTSHGALLLFSDPGAVNRQVAVVSDLSNGGRGLLGLTGNAGYDLLPERLTAQGTLALARTPDGEALGQELGAGLVAHPLPLLDVGLRGAVVQGARVSDPSTGQLSELPAFPWTVLAHLQWVLF